MSPVVAGVLAHYPPSFAVAAVLPFVPADGFSGAMLWHVRTATGEFALRAWPPNTTADRLTFIHRLQHVARTARLDFVPALVPTQTGVTSVSAGNHRWELASWQPGASVWLPRVEQVAAAGHALARLHAVWADITPHIGPSPAVRRRLALARDWLAHSPSEIGPDDELSAWCVRARRLLRGRVERVPAQLSPWVERSVRLQACLCDIWRAHVLFTDDRVTGIVDFGAARHDHIAADLARLFGSLCADDEALWQAGFDGYGRVTVEEMALARVLDRTGTLLGLANWLLRIDAGMTVPRSASAHRLGELVERVESWDSTYFRP